MLCGFAVAKLVLFQAMQGLKWGDLFGKSYSNQYFLTSCCITVPLMIVYCQYTIQNTLTQYKDMPEI
jgi:hypothetical protein